MLVVALCLTVAATEAGARELRAADTQSEDYPTVQALRFMGHVISERSVARFGDPERIFFNINSPEDLERAEQLLAGRGRFSHSARLLGA